MQKAIVIPIKLLSTLTAAQIAELTQKLNQPYTPPCDEMEDRTAQNAPLLPFITLDNDSPQNYKNN